MLPGLIRGRIAGLAAAAGYGVVTSFSKLAYEGGANPATVMSFRFLAGCILLGAIMAVRRRGWRLDMPWRSAVILAVCWYLISFGHLGAVHFIPVSLGAVIFYTFPLLVVAYKRAVDRAPATWIEIVCFVSAFTGLCIALGPTLADTDWRGIALAATASISAAAFLIVYEHAGRGVDELSAGFWLGTGALIVAVVVMAAGLNVALPSTGRGIFGMTAVAAFGLVAFLLNLAAVRLAGAAATAMLLNLEPVVIFAAAVLIVGETITAARVSGLVLVVAALLLSQWSALRAGNRA